VYPPVNILSWDIFGYYLYLPAQFIYHDLKLHDLNWVNFLVEKYKTTETLYQLYPINGTHWVIKESIGLAVLNSPAFFVAHWISPLLGFSADGFSLPYQYAFAISGLLFACLGVFMMRKILLEYFNDRLSSLLLLILVIGTNYFQQTAFEGFLTHNYIFTIYTFIIWFTIRWHASPKAWYAAGLGFSLGLAVLCRPTEMVAILIPFLWGIYNKISLDEKWQVIRRNWTHLLILAAAMFAGGFPQMLYWKIVTGHWIYYTYQNPGEGLDLWAPYTIKFLFSFRKGWFIYTPVMVFALIGFYSLLRHKRELMLAFTVYFLINLWVISSWTAWWYGGGSYSQRAMLPSYVIMALPLGYLLQDLRKKSQLLRSAIFTIMVSLVLLNIFQTWQWVHGIIDRTRMTRAYYFAIFGKTKVNAEDRKLLLIDKLAPEIIPEDKSGLEYRRLFFEDYENMPPGDPYTSDTSYAGKQSRRVTPTSPFAGGFEIPYNSLTDKEYAWIRASLRIFPLSSMEESPASLVATFEHKGEAYHYRAESLVKPEYQVIPGKWNYVQLDYLTPDIRSERDKLKVYFWLQGKSDVLIDDLKVEMWEPQK
jgi:hypothetical protein